MDCKTCKEHKRDVQPVPYIVHEAAMARQERHAKRLVIALVLAVVMIFASNMAWLWFFNQYEYVAAETQTVTVDGKDGVANFIGADGSIVNGSDTSGDYNDGSNAEKERTKQGDAQTQKEKP